MVPVLLGALDRDQRVSAIRQSLFGFISSNTAHYVRDAPEIRAVVSSHLQENLFSALCMVIASEMAISK